MSEFNVTKIYDVQDKFCKIDRLHFQKNVILVILPTNNEKLVLIFYILQNISSVAFDYFRNN